MSLKLLESLSPSRLPKLHLPKPHLPELYLPWRRSKFAVSGEVMSAQQSSTAQPSAAHLAATAEPAPDLAATASAAPPQSAASILPPRPSRSDLINLESSYGRTLFGPIPAGHRREFFHDKNNIWLWHEAWTAADGTAHEFTIRYEVRPTGVYKKLGAGQYVQLEGAELENFRRAAHAYLDLIKTNLYHKS